MAPSAHSAATAPDNWATARRPTATPPCAVPGLAGVIAIAAGGDHSLALRNDGTVWAWGQNYSGELGDGTNTPRATPMPVKGLAGIVAIAAGSSFSFAIRNDGAVFAWGANWASQLGDGSGLEQSLPVAVGGLAGTVAIAGGGTGAMALKSDGTVRAWGNNIDGRLGDGTFATRDTPVVVLREDGGGRLETNDWFLDLNPAIPKTIPPESIPVFLIVAATAAGEVTANLRFRGQDLGTTGSVFAFALAPADIVKAAADGSAPFAVGKSVSRGGSKADGVACVLAQLNSSGQLQAVSASSLQAYITGVLSAQGQAVQVINGASAVNIGGATFYVGYGTSASAMLNGGINRSVVSVPGTRECKPQSPQTGWWWNPQQGGRGFSIEAAGNNLFMAAYLYDISGRSTWHVAAGPTSLDGSVFNGQLLSFGNGVTLNGPYRANARLADAGPVTLTFDDAQHGTLVWPGGTVAIQRYGFGANGTDTPALANQPENGWWWGGAADNGRGFFIEWQGNRAFVAGYMYDADGNAAWYVADAPVASAQTFTGTWLQFASGQTLTGAYRAPTLVNGNVAPVTIQFQGADTALLTLPSGTLPITRFRF